MASQGTAHFADVCGLAGPLLLKLEYRDLFAVRLCCAALIGVSRAPLISALADEAAEASIGEHGERQRTIALRGLTAVVGRGVPAGGEQRAVSLATRCLQEGGATVRHAAISTFTRAAKGTVDQLSQLAVRHLGPMLADSDVRVSTAAAKALQQIVPRGDAAAVEAVLPLLRHLTASVRRVAVTTLSELAMRGDGRMVEAVSKLGHRELDWSVRLAVARALPRLAMRGDAMAHACLSALLQDLNEVVRRVAAGAIVHIADSPSDPFQTGAHPLHLKRRGLRRVRSIGTPSPPRSRPQRRLARHESAPKSPPRSRPQRQLARQESAPKNAHFTCAAPSATLVAGKMPVTQSERAEMVPVRDPAAC